MKTLNLLLSFFFLAFFSFQAHGQTYIGSKKQINKILKNIELFSTYVMASDHEKIADCYTEDGKLFPNNLEIIEGRAALEKFWKQPEGNSIPYHKITPVEIKITGKEAYDYGYYEGRSKNEKGEEFSWKGKYVIIWRKVGKNWKIYLDSWSRIKD